MSAGTGAAQRIGSPLTGWANSSTRITSYNVCYTKLLRESGITSRIGLQSGFMLDNYSSLLAYNGSNASLGQLLETGLV